MASLSLSLSTSGLGGRISFSRTVCIKVLLAEKNSLRSARTRTYGVVKQLLQLLVGVIDAELLKAVELEDLEAGDVEDADEAGALPLGSVQGPVDPGDDPFKQPLENGLGDGLDGELDLLLGLGLGDVVASHLDARPQEALGQLIDVDAEEVGDLLGHGVVGQDGLLGVSLLLELHVAEQEDTGDHLPDGGDVLVSDAHDAHGFDGSRELLGVILAGDGHPAAGQECVVLGVLQDVFLCKIAMALVIASEHCRFGVTSHEMSSYCAQCSDSSDLARAKNLITTRSSTLRC